MSLISKLAGVGSADTKIMAEQDFFKDIEFVKTDLPILNLAFSGEVDKGLHPGISIIAGDSKTFKSALSLYCLKAYLDRYKDGIGIIYDTEYGITPEYIKTFGIDTSRVLHIPVEHIEQLKFDIVKKLDAIKTGDKVFFMIDSIGQISSKKEVEDATNEKSVADMTRAKALRSVFRLITMPLTKKKLPCVMINHVYKSQDFMPVTVIPGGTSVTYSANTIFVVTKSQEKDSDGDLGGWNFNITINKSRYVREKSKFSFRVMYEDGIQRYSGLLDLALEEGSIIKPQNGWYQLIDKETGEIIGSKFRAAEAETKDILGTVIERDSFKQFVISKYKLAQTKMISDEEVDSALDNLEVPE